MARIIMGEIPQSIHGASTLRHFQQNDVACFHLTQSLGVPAQKSNDHLQKASPEWEVRILLRVCRALVEASAHLFPYAWARRAGGEGGTRREAARVPAAAPPSGSRPIRCCGWSRRPGGWRPGRVWRASRRPCSAPAVREMASHLSSAAPAIVSPGVA